MQEGMVLSDEAMYFRVCWSAECIIYIMEHHSGSSYQHFLRHSLNPNTLNVPTSPNLNQYPINQCPPRSSQFPNRPASSNAHRPPLSQSYMPRPQSNVDISNRDLKLDSMARMVSQRQGNPHPSSMQLRRRNSSRQDSYQIPRSSFNQYAVNPKANHSLVTSTLMTNLWGNGSSLPERSDYTIPKSPTRFYPPVPRYDHENPGFNINLGQQNDDSCRQSKTDRDVPRKAPLFGNSSNTPEAKQPVASNSRSQFIPKVCNAELDSTYTSSVAANGTDKLEPSLPARGSNFYVKRSSPINYWPLSISPSEENRSSHLNSQLCRKMETQKLIANTQDASNNEFKKKKNFDFLRNMNRKLSSASTPFPISKKLQLDDFQLMDKIGKGAFGDVYMAQEKATGFLCVIKKLQKKKIAELKIEEQIMREIKIQAFLQHRHLISLYGFFSDEKCIYLVLELMPDGSLMQVRKKRKIPEEQVSHYIRQICFGMKYMHNDNVIHRDIKPENIFLNDSYAKIGDFGCSIYSLTHRMTQIGSFAYISPQQMKLDSYNEKIDVWSVGVMTYEMLVGASPFEADIIEIAKCQKAPELSELRFPANVELSVQAKSFLIAMLQLDPKVRLGIDEALRHEFIQKYIRKEEEVPADRHPI